ncbi:CHAT domain-containing protein [Microbacterium allomyrinae]|uniref:CHAT domain-containing protein n=1 Tax=Microbacterium allomyrinae TaxID=2830666 RepID=A0A9X1LX35_9MICO|nr:CHAT domain-containing protein [Microbacterium allomyrinae]MCC2033685.1 CHAT domain-containing protein [Microbacterium allomyrinae]
MMRADDPSGAWQASAEAERLRDRARERQWSGTGSRGVQARIDIDTVRAELDARTALIAYVFTGDALAAVVVRHDRAQLVALGDWAAVAHSLPGLRADLDMAATMRTGPVAGVVARSLSDRLASLSRSVLDGPAGVADADRLVITAPGILNGIPWAMLPGMAGRAFTVAVSATRWERMRRRGPFAHDMAAFAAGPRVTRAEEEIETAVAAWTRSTAVTADAATVERVTVMASRADVLHVAAHGRHAIDNPLFSGLELSDGTLFGYDIDLIPTLPDTVVLSACKVGRSSVRWGEEAVGMTRIWLHAGARCVVATPVVVADDDACELLGAMHAGLAAGVSPSEALAAASERTGIVAPFQVHGAGF